MASRNTFLTAVAKSPDDDGPRLDYADYLHKYAVSDLDAATAEYALLTCGPASHSTRQKAVEHEWLDANWHRLVPGLVTKGFTMYRRTLGTVYAGPPVWEELDPSGQFPRKGRRQVALSFSRGFVAAAVVEHGCDVCDLYDVARDQPLAHLVCEPAVRCFDPCGSRPQSAVVLVGEMPQPVWDLINGFDAVDPWGSLPPAPTLTEMIEKATEVRGKTFYGTGSPYRLRERAEGAVSAAIRQAAFATQDA